MIANVALQATEPASAAPAAGETGDTGAFDALLELQSQANADAAGTVSAQLASDAEAELLAGTLEDSAEDSDDVAEPGDDALWFITALLPVSKAAPTAVAAGSGSAQPIHIPQADAGAVAQAVAQAAVTSDLAQAFASEASAGDDVELPASAPGLLAAGPALDTTTWNSLTGPAELFAQGTRHVAARVESAALTSHVRDPRWADELGNRLASMVRTGESSASLQLTPVDLGPMEVNVAVRDNQATVHFGAANAETRALLEASIPRLREMLQAQGFALMDSSVSHGFAKSTRHESAGTPRVNEIGEAPIVSATRTHITGLLDLYA
jgi:flagellar hook-length control protein FliK